MTLDVCIVGGGLAGLACALSMSRLRANEMQCEEGQKLEPLKIEVFERRDELADRDGGSGMSVIGHSLLLLRSLGLDLSKVMVQPHDGSPPYRLAAPQPDVSLRQAADFRGKVAGDGLGKLYQVPCIDSDPGLAKIFGSVQVNVHRGELHEALLQAALAAGVTVHAAKRCSAIEERQDSVTVSFDDGTSVDCSMLVGADGVHSVVRRHLFNVRSSNRLSPFEDPMIRDSGYTCWRGLIPDTAEFRDRNGGPGMFKTVVSPAGCSFTSGTIPNGRRFWLLDAGGPKRPDARKIVRVEDVVDAMRGFDDGATDMVRNSQASQVIVTDVFDAVITKTSRFGKGRVVLIGDAAHAVVHHFGQGACMAIEDSVALCRSIAANGGTTQLQQSTPAMIRHFDSWSHWARCMIIVLLSRTCGQLYMSSFTWFTHPFLRICLAWPFSVFFTLLVRLLLFTGGSSLREFAAHNLA